MQRHMLTSSPHSGRSIRPRRRRPSPPGRTLLTLLARMVFLAAALATAPATGLRAQCVVENGSFETVTTSALNLPGYSWAPASESPIPGCPGWYSRDLSPDIFWPPAHVPTNYMSVPGSRTPAHGNNYAGIFNQFVGGVFRSEVLAGTLTSSPVGAPYQVRARLAMGRALRGRSMVQISLDGPSTTPYVVGTMLVADTDWQLFSQFINLPPGTTYDRIVIQAVGTPVVLADLAYVFIDSVDICRAEPCDYLGTRLASHPDVFGNCCFDLLVDNATTPVLAMPAAVRVTTSAPAEITGTTSSGGWSVTTASATQVTWRMSAPGATIPTGSGIAAGHFCVAAHGASPQRNIVELLDTGGVVICADTIYTTCEDQPPPCLDMLGATIVCDSLDASGQRRYAVSFEARPRSRPTFPAGSVIQLRSPQGTVSPASYPLSGASTMVGPIRFTDVAPADTEACIIAELHVWIGNRDTILCTDTLCLTLPDCPEDCCTNFTKQVMFPYLTYVNGTVDLAGCIIAGPGQIKEFTATLVSANTRKRCTAPASLAAWERISGGIAAGTLTTLLPGPWPAPPPPGTIWSIPGREITWGGSESPACASFASCAPYTLRLAFPDPPMTAGCADTLRFSIRYRFTDCQCRTCDTLITYTLPRVYTGVPWVVGTIPLGTSGRPPFSAIPGLLRIDMSSETSGTLSVTLPEPEQGAPAIRITGMSIRPLGVGLVDIVEHGTQQASASIEGNRAELAFTLDGGASALFDVTYANGNHEWTVPNVLRFRYQIVGDPAETEYETDDILVEARVPGIDGDVVHEQSPSPASDVRTYVLHVDADNAAGEQIQAIRVTVDGGSARLIAAGPVGDGNGVTLTPGVDADGNSVVQIDRGSWAEMPIAAGSSLMPVYLTFSDAASGASIEYQTINAAGAVLTSGTVQLGSPLQAAGPGGGEDDREPGLGAVYPNPAGTSATVGFHLPATGRVKLSIRDARGQEVLRRVDSELMSPGDHLLPVATDTLAQGTYIVVLDVDGRISTRTLTIKR